MLPPIAQPVEQLPFKQTVAGSSPAGRTRESATFCGAFELPPKRAKLAAGRISVVEAVAVPDGKTKSLVTQLGSLGVKAEPTLLVVRELGDAVLRASRNVPWLTVETPGHVSVYQLLSVRQVVCERAGLAALEEALAR